MEPDLVPIELTVNGSKYRQQVKPSTLLLELLREELGLKGTKKGCNSGHCGSCTVLMEGKPINSCSVLAVQANGKTITTIEGIAEPGMLHPLQKAFIAEGAVQCGFCTPGMIMSAKGLLDRNQDPSESEIRAALSGNLCRCTGYVTIVQAVHQAAIEMKSAKQR